MTKSNLKDFINEAKSTARFLFISFNKDGKEAAIKKKIKETLFIEWDDLSIVDGDIMVKRQKKLSEFEFVFVGTVGDHADLSSSILSYIKINKMKHFFYGSSSETCNKMLQSVNLLGSNVPQIKTVISRADKISASSLITSLSLPIISKIIHGSQGKGIKKHDTKEDLANHLKKNPEESYIFQEFIPNDGDLRIFYVRNKLLYSIRRKSAKDTEFRNNTSLGGSKESIKLEPEAKKISDKANDAMKFDATGVDLIQHKVTKKWYVMEINAAPQFSGDYFEPVMDELIRLIKG